MTPGPHPLEIPQGVRDADDASGMPAPIADLTGELPPSPPTAARTGTWTIRPDQALRWATISQPGVPMPAPVVHSSFGAVRALGVVAMVLVAGLAGGIGAWAIAP